MPWAMVYSYIQKMRMATLYQYSLKLYSTYGELMKKIIFRPNSETAAKIVPKPKPAKHYFPDWYKKKPKFDNNKMEININGQANTTMKACMPFLDTFTSGYIQETWCDIYFKNNGENIEWRYASNPEILESRLRSYIHIDGFSSEEFAWRQVWIPQLPRGYSMLYTHPLNRFDLPFLSLSGIVDNDQYYMENLANHPFFVKEGFEGIIPKGTPMIQMIPIKRDSWSSSFEDYSEDLKLKFLNVRSYFYDGYKKLYWQKKNYS